MKPIFDETFHNILKERIQALEDHFDADFLFYYGPIHDSIENPFRDALEELNDSLPKKNRLCIILNTPGGSAESVEILVTITRFHYNEVYFIVPDSAYSAGTIFCMSGDKIIMDYSSSLGPIDPQVFNGTNWVPALGYLDKVKEIIDKSMKGKVSEAEIMMLSNLDLALLKRHEQARDLTITLLKQWLVKYKFKNWNKHSSTGKPVTTEEKTKRAAEIARDLGNNNLWHSHGRSIGIEALTNILRLKIDDYSADKTLRKLIRDYNDLICQYILRTNTPVFLHTRKFN
jgi:Serine dehydrogenase proteinase